MRLATTWLVLGHWGSVAVMLVPMLLMLMIAVTLLEGRVSLRAPVVIVRVLVVVAPLLLLLLLLRCGVGTGLVVLESLKVIELVGVHGLWIEPTVL